MHRRLHWQTPFASSRSGLVGYIAIIMFVMVVSASPANPRKDFSIADRTAVAGSTACRVAFSPQGGVMPLVLASIAQATARVDVAMFYLSHDALIDTLCRLAAESGVLVRLVVDVEMTKPARKPILDRLQKSGVSIFVVTLPKHGKMHLKTAIIDGHMVLTGAANWSEAADQSNYEDMLAIYSSSVAAQYLAEFDGLVNSADLFGGSSAETVRPTVKRSRSPHREAKPNRDLPGTAVTANRLNIYFTPGRAAVADLVAMLRKAKSVDIGMYLLTDAELVGTLKEVAQRITVRLIVDSEMLNGDGLSVLQELWDSGVKVSCLHKDRAILHLKTAVVDHRYVWTGSGNWTTSAMDCNAEDILYVDSPALAELYGQTLNKAEMASRSFGEQALPRLKSKTVKADQLFDVKLPRTGPRTDFTNVVRVPFSSFAVTGLVSYVADGEYQPILLNLIQSARQTILVTMYAMPEQKSDAPAVDQIIAALEKATGRGVYVYFLLYTPSSSDDRLSEAHSNWAERLRRAGVDVRLALPGIPLHEKMVVVDMAMVLVGSHNWSEGAMSGKRVYESSALLVLRRQEPRFAEYVFGRRTISDMRSQSQWEEEIALLRHLDKASAAQRDGILNSVNMESAP